MPQQISSIFIDDKALRDALRVAPDRVKRSTHEMLERAGIMTQSAMRTKVTTGVSGELKKSIRYRFSDYLSVVIQPTAKYAAAHEYGSRPHWTSVKNLERWAKARGINAFALQRSIAKKGTKPHPFMQRTLREVDSVVLPDFSRGMNKTIAEILAQ